MDESKSKKPRSRKRREADNPLRRLLANPAARVYLLIGMGGLVVLVVTMFLIDSPLAATLLLCTGLMGLFFRWTAMPLFTVMVMAYFSFAPSGVPIGVSRYSLIPNSSFRITDIIIIGSCLVYLLAQYRLLALIHQGMPSPFGKERQPNSPQQDSPTLRQPAPITDAELSRFFIRVALVILAGQCLWLFVTRMSLDFRQFPPLVLADPQPEMRFDRTSFREPLIRSGLNRYLLSTGSFVVLAAGVGLLFWYWRLHTINPDQARLILTDTAWAEQRRQLSRQERWRADAKDRMLGTKTPVKPTGCLFYLMIVIIVVGFGLVSMCCLGLITE